VMIRCLGLWSLNTILNSTNALHRKYINTENREVEYHYLQVYSQVWPQESLFDLAVNKYLVI
ncbi:unnamed protein product, partial [Bubo scandiacus]